MELLKRVKKAILDGRARATREWWEGAREDHPDAVREGEMIRKIVEAEAMAAIAAILNVPETNDFAVAVGLEAQHQQERWGAEHDAGKTDLDWFWLIGWLGGKAVHNPDVTPENATEKKLHRIITVAAACMNWHAQVKNGVRQGSMRPGIDSPGGDTAETST